MSASVLMTAATAALSVLIIAELAGSQEAISPISTETDNLLPCDFASLQCSYRTGCGRTLKSYLVECSDLIANKTQTCSEGCKNTLVGLTSTKEGKDLMECRCSDDSCLKSKARIEACRESVMRASGEGATVSCSEARWICFSDAECGKALEYYNLFCRSMFRGVRCTERCRNSLSILRKQQKADKLEHCRCESDEFVDEVYRCADVKANMRELCFGVDDGGDDDETDLDENELDGEGGGAEDGEPVSGAAPAAVVALPAAGLLAVMTTVFTCTATTTA